MGEGRPTWLPSRSTIPPSTSSRLSSMPRALQACSVPSEAPWAFGSVLPFSPSLSSSFTSFKSCPHLFKAFTRRRQRVEKCEAFFSFFFEKLRIQKKKKKKKKKS